MEKGGGTGFRCNNIARSPKPPAEWRKQLPKDTNDVQINTMCFLR